MKGLILVCCFFLLVLPATGQVPSTTPEFKNASLQERFQWMKSSAQTFQDYKVIKEVTLDKEWRIMLDSVKGGIGRLREAKAESGKLQSELSATRNELKQKMDSMVPTEFAANHINFIGIDISKTAFTAFFLTVVAVLVALVLLILGRLKMVNGDVKDKSDAFERVTRELEDYKHKALEKQTKLSRELQNERNRLQEMRGSKV